MGFHTCIMPKADIDNIRIKSDMKLLGLQMSEKHWIIYKSYSFYAIIKECYC